VGRGNNSARAELKQKMYGWKNPTMKLYYISHYP